MPGKIIHFDIPADDVSGMVSFYRNVMGWIIEKYADEPGIPEYWLIQPEPGNTDAPGGGIGAKGMPDQKPVNYYEAEGGLEAFNQRVRDNGGTIVIEKMAVPGFGWFSMCVDPEGNQFAGWVSDPKAG